MIRVIFKVVRAIVGFVIGVVLSVVILVYLGKWVREVSRPRYEWHDTMSFVLQDYERCSHFPEGTKLTCPICDQYFYKEDGMACCSEEHEKTYWILKDAWNQGDRETIEKYGKVYNRDDY